MLTNYPTRNHNRKLQTSKAPLKSQAQGTSLFTSAASNQRGFLKNSPWEAQVRFPEGERMRQIRGVFQTYALTHRCAKPLYVKHVDAIERITIGHVYMYIKIYIYKSGIYIYIYRCNIYV